MVVQFQNSTLFPRYTLHYYTRHENRMTLDFLHLYHLENDFIISTFYVYNIVRVCIIHTYVIAIIIMSISFGVQLIN